MQTSRPMVHPDAPSDRPLASRPTACECGRSHTLATQAPPRCANPHTRATTPLTTSRGRSTSCNWPSGSRALGATGPRRRSCLYTTLATQSGVDLGPIWGGHGVDLGWIWGGSRADLGCRGRSGADLGPIWDRSGIDPGVSLLRSAGETPALRRPVALGWSILAPIGQHPLHLRRRDALDAASGAAGALGAHHLAARAGGGGACKPSASTGAPASELVRGTWGVHEGWICNERGI